MPTRSATTWFPNGTLSNLGYPVLVVLSAPRVAKSNDGFRTGDSTTDAIALEIKGIDTIGVQPRSPNDGLTKRTLPSDQCVLQGFFSAEEAVHFQERRKKHIDIIRQPCQRS
jgi:hypothetical protein